MSAGRIVVIDDCRLTLAIAREILEGAGYQVITTVSGIEANPHIYASPRPDLILIDVEMPLLRGDSKVRLLKAGKASRDIPVALMSHKPAEELAGLCRSSGADGYIPKPLQPAVLLERIQGLLGARR